MAEAGKAAEAAGELSLGRASPSPSLRYTGLLTNAAKGKVGHMKYTPRVMQRPDRPPLFGFESG